MTSTDDEMAESNGRVAKNGGPRLFGEFGGTPETIQFSQVGVSRAREATF